MDRKSKVATVAVVASLLLVITLLTPAAADSIYSLLTHIKAKVDGMAEDIGTFPTTNYNDIATFVEDIRSRLTTGLLPVTPQTYQEAVSKTYDSGTAAGTYTPLVVSAGSGEAVKFYLTVYVPGDPTGTDGDKVKVLLDIDGDGTYEVTAVELTDPAAGEFYVHEYTANSFKIEVTFAADLPADWTINYAFTVVADAGVTPTITKT